VLVNAVVVTIKKLS